MSGGARLLFEKQRRGRNAGDFLQLHRGLARWPVLAMPYPQDLNSANADLLAQGLVVLRRVGVHPGLQSCHGAQMYAQRTENVNDQCTREAMVGLGTPVHHAYMAQPRHFLRQWREHKEMSLEQVAERIALLSQERNDADPEAKRLTMTHATLSRIERGLIQYGQHLLEILAEIYQTDPGSLIMRDPSEPEGIWSIWDQLRPAERHQVVEIAKTIHRTGQAA